VDKTKWWGRRCQHFGSAWGDVGSGGPVGRKVLRYEMLLSCDGSGRPVGSGGNKYVWLVFLGEVSSREYKWPSESTCMTPSISPTGALPLALRTTSCWKTSITPESALLKVDWRIQRCPYRDPA
jgi:hypothetical protein